MENKENLLMGILCRNSITGFQLPRYILCYFSACTAFSFVFMAHILYSIHALCSDIPRNEVVLLLWSCCLVTRPVWLCVAATAVFSGCRPLNICNRDKLVFRLDRFTFIKYQSGDRGCCLSPGIFGRQARYTLDRLPVHHRVYKWYFYSWFITNRFLWKNIVALDECRLLINPRVIADLEENCLAVGVPIVDKKFICLRTSEKLRKGCSRWLLSWVSCSQLWPKALRAVLLRRYLIPGVWSHSPFSDVSHRQDVSAAAHTALKCSEIQSRPNRLSFPFRWQTQTVQTAAEMWSSFEWHGAKPLLEMVCLVRRFACKGLENLPG